LRVIEEEIGDIEYKQREKILGKFPATKQYITIEKRITKNRYCSRLLQDIVSYFTTIKKIINSS